MREAMTRAALATVVAILALGNVAARAQPPQCQYQQVTAPQLLFSNITYETIKVACAPHQTLAHVLAIDVGSGAISLASSSTTPSSSTFTMQPPTAVLVGTGASVAVNANLFTNCCVYAPSTKQALLQGWEVSGGEVLSAQGANPDPAQNYPFNASLAQQQDGTVQIVYSGAGQPVPGTVVTAVTGSHMLVFGQKNVAPAGGSDPDFFGPNARTVAGLSTDGATLWLVALDRSASLSGLTLQEAAVLMLYLGADRAINLDGGGSTSMVSAAGGSFAILNAPADMPSNGACSVYYPDAAQPVSCVRFVGATLSVLARAAAGKPARR